MNDAVKGQVEAVCKSQLWRVSKFICDNDQTAFACEIVMSNIDDFKPKIVQSDGKPVDKSLNVSAVVYFAEIYGHFIISTINGYRSTTQSQVKRAMKERFMTMEPIDYPTPGQCLKAVLWIGLTFDKEDPTKGDKERDILLWHADSAVPKCAGSEFWTRPQRCEGLMSSVGPKDGHVDTYVTPSTEAIVCVYFENLLSKVIYEVEMDKLHLNAKPGSSHDKKNDRWLTKWSDTKIGQSTFGGWKSEALTKFLAISNAITESRTKKRTKIADKWLLRAILNWHKYVEKDQKTKKVKILAPTAPAAEVVIVPFDCEQGPAAKSGGVDREELGITLLDIESEHALKDSDTDSEGEDESGKEDGTDPQSGANPPLGTTPGSIPVQAGNPATPAAATAPTGAPTAAS